MAFGRYNRIPAGQVPWRRAAMGRRWDYFFRRSSLAQCQHRGTWLKGEERKRSSLVQDAIESSSMHSMATIISVNVHKVAEDEIAASADLIRQGVSVSQETHHSKRTRWQAGRADLGLLKPQLPSGSSQPSKASRGRGPLLLECSELSLNIQ